MDDLSAHYYSTVGQLLDLAAVGRLQVRVELSDGVAAEGVPSKTRERSDAELDDTGYPHHVRIGGQLLALEQVRRATIVHPYGGRGDDKH
jgi:hypothetical protein